MATILPYPKFQAWDDNGNPLVGGKLYTYLAGTTTKKATYTDSTGSAANTNPVILDARGEADVWGDGTYKLVLKDKDDVTIWTKDDIPVPGSSTSSSGGGGLSSWVTHDVEDAQAATALSGETVDSSVYSSADYIFEIKRGTTVFANGTFSLQYLNDSWRIQLGQYRSDILHGVTFSLTGTTTAQLNAALDNGAGDGTIKLSRRLIPA